MNRATQKVQLSTLPSSAEHSQVFTQTDVEVAQQLADQLNLPRLQGERFAVQPGQIGVLLGSDARQLFARPDPLRTPVACQSVACQSVACQPAARQLTHRLSPEPPPAPSPLTSEF